MFIAPPPKDPTKIFAGAIAEYENIWPDHKEIVEKIEEVCSTLPTEEGGFYSAKVLGKIPEVFPRTNSELCLTIAGKSNEFLRELNNRFYLTLLEATEGYCNKFNIEALYHNEWFNLLRYQTGEEYKAHFDGGTPTKRCVSSILYLNDDYEGGHLEFVNFDIKIKPKAGHMYVFPSNYAYAHIAHPVISGTKYAIVTWSHDVPQ